MDGKMKPCKALCGCVTAHTRAYDEQDSPVWKCECCRTLTKRSTRRRPVNADLDRLFEELAGA